MSARLKGEVAVVSGAAGGIGAAIVRRFAAEGAAVAGLDLADDGPGEPYVPCDLADGAAVAEAAARVRAALGPPTVLVHAAAITEHADTLDSSPTAFARVHDVNVGGALRLVQAFAPDMRAAGRGSIVLISSINALMGAPGLAAYAASKGALNTMARTLALELAPDGVRVNLLCPASIDTPMLAESFARRPDAAAARAANVTRHPLGRLGTPDDVAAFALFLASGESEWVTGGVHLVDGGASITRR